MTATASKSRNITEGGVTRAVEFRPDTVDELFQAGILSTLSWNAARQFQDLQEQCSVGALSEAGYSRPHMDRDVLTGAGATLSESFCEALTRLRDLRRSFLPDEDLFRVCVIVTTKSPAYSARIPRPTIVKAFERLTDEMGF